jgi:transposase
MPRYLLTPTLDQADVMREHCAQARFAWNLAVEQQSWWRRGRITGPQAQRVRRLNRHHGQVWIPKTGWVRFRWSRAVPDAKSYRVTMDRAGRWHIAFAAIPEPVAGPGTGEVVGVDRGVAVSAALSTAEMLTAPRLSPGHQRRLLILQRKLARAQRGSNRRAKVKLAAARLITREAEARKDWCEKLSTDLAACGIRDREARESQASFRCRSCGHAVTARGGLPQLGRPLNREPQAAWQPEIPVL